jgi:hypothetical protein
MVQVLGTCSYNDFEGDSGESREAGASGGEVVRDLRGGSEAGDAVVGVGGAGFASTDCGHGDWVDLHQAIVGQDCAHPLRCLHVFCTGLRLGAFPALLGSQPRRPAGGLPRYHDQRRDRTTWLGA